MWLNFKRFKMPSAELFSDLIKQAMLLPICKNYTGSPFHTVSCSNIILLHKILPTLILIILIKSSSLTHGNLLSLSSVHPKKAIGRRGFAMASPTKWNRFPQLVRSQNTIIGFRSQLKTYLFRLTYPPP